MRLPEFTSLKIPTVWPFLGVTNELHDDDLKKTKGGRRRKQQLTEESGVGKDPSMASTGDGVFAQLWIGDLFMAFCKLRFEMLVGLVPRFQSFHYLLKACKYPSCNDWFCRTLPSFF